MNLDSLSAYFDHITRPAYERYKSGPVDFLSAFTVTMSLFHIHDWAYKYKKSELEAYFGKVLGEKHLLWKEVELAVSEAKYIRDVSNASKHVLLTQGSTTLEHVKNTTIESRPFGAGVYGAGRYGGRNFTLKDNGTDVSLDMCVKKVYEFWEGLVPKL